MANYFISDLHFGHKSVLSFDNRPFTNIEEHDQTLINNWNATVGMDDDVYVLGDISWYNATKTIDIFNQLNGSVHLIKGNHDGRLLRNRELQQRFCEITDYKELSLPEKKGLVLSHYPIPCFKNHYHGWYHFYGHVHNSYEWNMMEHLKKEMEELYSTPCNMFNVGAMMPYIDYTPRSLEFILESNHGTKSEI